jgi:drug/metabolite transporter (DMT)-like permease
MWIAALVVLSAFLHALWNALLRTQPDKDRAITAVMAVSALVGIAASVVEVALGGAPVPSWPAAGWGALAGVAEGIYFVALARGLTLGPLGPVYTVSRGGAVVLVWPASVLLFGEPVAGLALAGSAVVLAGLAVSGAERGASRAALAWALLAAVNIAVYHLAYKAALGAGASPPGVFAVAMAVATSASLLRRARSGAAPALPGRARWRLVAIGVVCAASFMLFLAALAVGGAGYVFTLRNTSVLFATALGAAIGDRPGARQIAGAVLVALGAVLLGLAE